MRRLFIALLVAGFALTAWGQMWPNPGPGRAAVGGGGGGPLAISHKEDNISTSNGFSTGSIAWTAGARGLIFVASATTGGTVTAHTASGGSVTWNQIGFIAYGSRRGISILLSDGTPSTGAITITATVSGTYQESQWSVDQITGFNASTIHDTVQTKATDSVTDDVLPDLGTFDTDDLAIFAVGLEDGTGLAPTAGSSTHVLRTGGGNVRALLVATSSVDATPGATWTNSASVGLVGAIFNTAP